MDVQIDVLNTFAKLETISAQWDELVEHSACNKAFSSYSWFTHSCRCFSIEPKVFVALRQGDVVGIFPLGVHENKNVVTFGEPLYSDYQDIIVAWDEKNPNVCMSLIESAANFFGDPHRLYLHNLRKDSNLLTALIALEKEREIRYRLRAGHYCSYVDISPGWEAFLKSKSSNFRKSVKANQRKIEDAGLHAHFLQKEDRLNRSLVDTFLDLHLNRMTSQGRRSPFEKAEVQAFIRLVFPDLIRKGLLRVHLLIRDPGSLLGIFIETVGFQGVGAWQVGFHAKLHEKHLSPGTFLLSEAIRRACIDGYQEYDFMRGTEDYKKRWSTGERSTFSIEL